MSVFWEKYSIIKQTSVTSFSCASVPYTGKNLNPEEIGEMVNESIRTTPNKSILKDHVMSCFWSKFPSGVRFLWREPVHDGQSSY